MAPASGDKVSAELLANIGDMNIQQIRKGAVVFIEQNIRGP